MSYSNVVYQSVQRDRFAIRPLFVELPEVLPFLRNLVFTLLSASIDRSN